MATGRGLGIVTDGLVLCLDAANKDSYPGSGTTWSDLSGNGNNGTLVNGASFAELNGVRVMRCDGTNDRIDVPKDLAGFVHNIQYDLNWSIECWMYTYTFDSSPQTYKIIYGNYNGCNYNVLPGNAQGLIMYSTTTNPYFNFGYGPRNNPGGSQCPQVSVSWTGTSISSLILGFQNNWKHFVLSSYDGTTLSIYVDGEFIESKTVAFKNSTSQSDNNLTSTSNYSFGGEAAGNSANEVDFSMCSIYNRALTGSEVKRNYNATKSRFGL